MPKQLPLPKKYQKKISKRVVRDKAVALHVGMGLGKTRAVLMGLEKLIKQKRKYKRVLVVGPIPVVESTWPDEIKKWRINLTYQLIRHKKPVERIKQMRANADIFAINFEMLSWLARREHVKWFKQFDILVIDELTKTKSTKSAPFRALKGRRDWFKKRIGMTGMIVPESYTNLYGQMSVLTQIWDTKLAFLEKYFVDESHDSRYHKYKLKSKKARRKLEKKVAPYMLTLDSKDYLEVPEWTVQDYWFDLSPRARKYYDKFEAELFLEFNDDEIELALLGDDDETEVVADTSSSMKIKLRQIISGFLYNENKNALVFDKTKFDFVRKITDEIDENTILMYQLIEEKRQLIEEYDALLLKGKDAIRQWNSGKVQYATGHPMGMGHGLNLQDGGRVLLWYSLPRSHEQYAQTIARLIRTGQLKNVIIIRVLARDTIDEVIVTQMGDKEDEQQNFTDNLKAYRDRRARRKRQDNVDKATLPKRNSHRRNGKGT